MLSEYCDGQKTLIYCLEITRMIENAGHLINESGVRLNMKGVSSFDQMVADGFRPTDMNILECLCHHNIFDRYSIPYLMKFICLARDEGVDYLLESLDVLNKVSENNDESID